jgi:hypothetical protein
MNERSKFIGLQCRLFSFISVKEETIWGTSRWENNITMSFKETLCVCVCVRERERERQ